MEETNSDSKKKKKKKSSFIEGKMGMHWLHIFVLCVESECENGVGVENKLHW